MKHIIAIISLAILFRPALPLIDYAINYDYIANELCVNKDKPIMGCNGKCYLMKELAKASESEKPQSSDKKNPAVEKIDLFFLAITDIKLTRITFSNILPKSKLTKAYSNPDLKSVFHPPVIIS